VLEVGSIGFCYARKKVLR